MPTYEFKCPVCSSPKPVTQPIDQDLMAPSCDQCQVPMQRNWSAPLAIFKGDGFYVNDSKGKK